MTDWDEILEYIHHAMQAVDEAHIAAEQLKQEPNHENWKAFVEKMAQIREREARLQQVLDNEEAYAVDELMDALTMMFSGRHAEWRRTQHMGN